MNIGEQINNLRKQHGLSQDDFANLFNVSRQTISNWENSKSYPDLEMIIKVSDYFKISIDELLKNDVQTVKKLIMKKRQKRSILYYCQFYVLGTVTIWGLYSKYQDSVAVNFTMEKHETYKSNETKEPSMNIANGYFSVPKDEKLDIQVKGATDNGKLHITIADKDNKIYYQLDGQELKDLQTLYFEKGSYIIQIVADDYTEDIISLDYNIKIEN